MISKLLAAPVLRSDQWLPVLSMAHDWVAGNATIHTELEAALQRLNSIERFFCISGAALLERLYARLTNRDATGFLQVSRNISTIIVSQK